MSFFELDRNLEKDSFLIDVFHEIQIRTINDSRYIWFILVPALPHLKDWHDLQHGTEAKPSLAFINNKKPQPVSESNALYR